MATLMEKDVLIEAVAGVLALMLRKVERNKDSLNLNDDEIYFVKLRSQLYCTSHEKINFDDVIKKCQEAKIKYNSLPLS